MPNLLKKMVIRPGWWKDANEFNLILTRELIEAYLTGTRQLLSMGMRVPCFKDHWTDSVDDLLGHWKRFDDMASDGSVTGYVLPIGDAAEKRLQGLDCSAVLCRNVEINGTKIPYAMMRVDACVQGAIAGLGEFSRADQEPQLALSIRYARAFAASCPHRASVTIGAITVGRLAMNVGATIKSAREDKGWSLDDLAGKTNGIDASTIGQIERGDIEQPSEEALKELGDALGIGFDSLDSQVADDGQPEAGRFSSQLANHLADKLGIDGQDVVSEDDLMAALDARLAAGDPPSEDATPPNGDGTNSSEDPTDPNIAEIVAQQQDRIEELENMVVSSQMGMLFSQSSAPISAAQRRHVEARARIYRRSMSFNEMLDAIGEDIRMLSGSAAAADSGSKLDKPADTATRRRLSRAELAKQETPLSKSLGRAARLRTTSTDNGKSKTA